MNDIYKTHEDTKQEQYLDYARTHDETMFTSCKYLARRFLHSWNAYTYSCEIDDVDGCPKSSERGKANCSCLTDSYSVPFASAEELSSRAEHWRAKMGEDNNDDGDFAEK